MLVFFKVGECNDVRSLHSQLVLQMPTHVQSPQYMHKINLINYTAVLRQS